MIWVRKDNRRETCDECQERVCDNEKALRLSVAGAEVVIDPNCASELHAALGRELGRLTVNQLADMAYGTAKANGWHDNGDTLITSDNPYYLLAGLTPVKVTLAEIVEAVRKGDHAKICFAIDNLKRLVDHLERYGLASAAASVPGLVDELSTPINGSLTQVLAWLNLEDSESAEAMEAAINGDSANFAEELAADILIRIGDAIGAINDTPGHFLGPIDIEAAILAKDARNKQRGWRHGGKRA